MSRFNSYIHLEIHFQYPPLTPWSALVALSALRVVAVAPAATPAAVCPAVAGPAAAGPAAAAPAAVVVHVAE